MSVSVVMITYKHEAFIEQAIRSILDQDYKEIEELIIADDFSPDRTERIVEQMKQSHSRGYLIRYFRHKKNIGFQRNFKFALMQAKGANIAICEGDDFWTSTKKLSFQLSFLQNQPHLSLIACTSFTVRNDEQLEEQANKYQQIEFPYTLTINNFLDPYLLDTNTLVFRNQLNLKKIHYRGFKDIVLIALLLAKGEGILLQETLGAYRIHETGNWTSKSTDEKYVENLFSVRLLYRLFGKEHAGLYKFIRNCYQHVFEILLANPKLKYLTYTFAPSYYSIVKNDWSFKKTLFFKRLFITLFK